MLFDLVETVKRKAVAEAASFGQEVPIPALSDLSAAGVQFGVALPEADRTRLDNILRLLYGLIVRLNGLRGSSTAGRMRLTPRSRFCRNESRDEWVAHRVEERRAASKPPNWDEIFDGILKLAPSNDWSIPGSSKSLSEAHYRYNARQRKRDRKAKD
jgi:hypothetical protein